MSSVSDGASYAYNAAGEMIDDNGTTLGWSAFGKAVSVEQGVGGNSVSFAYGPDDARVEKNVVAGGHSETVLYFEGAERLTQGPYTAIRRTVTLADLTFIDTGGAGSHVLYPVTDNLGSTIALGAANGSLAQGMSYGPFGRRETAGWAGYMSQSEALTINTTETDRSYTGQEGLDAVGLMDYNARLYDPSLGRFLSVDPKIADPQGTQSINPYSYVGNNPLNATDPTGESKCVAGRPCSDPLAGQFDGLMAYNVNDEMAPSTDVTVTLASGAVKEYRATGALAGPLANLARAFMNPNAGQTLSNSASSDQSFSSGGATVKSNTPASNVKNQKPTYADDDPHHWSDIYSGKRNGTADDWLKINNTAGAMRDRLANMSDQEFKKALGVPYMNDLLIGYHEVAIDKSLAAIQLRAARHGIPKLIVGAAVTGALMIITEDGRMIGIKNEALQNELEKAGLKHDLFEEVKKYMDHNESAPIITCSASNDKCGIAN